MSPRTEQVSIYLRYISGGLTKETFIGYSLRGYRSTTVKNRRCNSSLLFFLPGGAAWQTSCFRHSGKTRFDPPNGCSPVRLCIQGHRCCHDLPPSHCLDYIYIVYGIQGYRCCHDLPPHCLDYIYIVYGIQGYRCCHDLLLLTALTTST